MFPHKKATERCRGGALSRKRKKKPQQDISDGSWQSPPFPGTPGPQFRSVREPKGIAFDPTKLQGMTAVQLRNQLRPLKSFRKRMRRRFPSLADLWRRTAKPAERQAADSLEQAEQLIQHIEKELLTRNRISGVGSNSGTHAIREAKADEAPTEGSGSEFSAQTEEPTFAASADYRSVMYKGETHILTRNQSIIVRLLHCNHAAGHPNVGKDRLLSAIECETGQVRNFFRNSPLWKTLVVSNRKGTYRLDLPDAVPPRIGS